MTNEEKTALLEKWKRNCQRMGPFMGDNGFHTCDREVLNLIEEARQQGAAEQREKDRKAEYEMLSIWFSPFSAKSYLEDIEKAIRTQGTEQSNDQTGEEGAKE